MAKQGRGRLSSIDLLPPDADPIVAWAFQELKARERLQKDIHEEFNERLDAVGAGPISMSAFNRHSISIARIARRHEDVRQMTAALTERLEPGQTDDLTIMAAETIKTLVFELLQDEDLKPKEAMELSRALQSAVNSQYRSIANAPRSPSSKSRLIAPWVRLRLKRDLGPSASPRSAKSSLGYAHDRS